MNSLKGLAKRLPGARGVAEYLRRQLAPPADRVIPFHATYNQDNLATSHWLSTNKRFENAIAGAIAKGLALSDEARWRVHVACRAAGIGKKLGGAFVECGVARGFLSRVIIDYLDWDGPFYLLDTYNGFDERFISKEQAEGLRKWREEHGGKNYYEDSYEQVVKTFSDKPKVRVIRGAVPETLPQVDADPRQLSVARHELPDA